MNIKNNNQKGLGVISRQSRQEVEVIIFYSAALFVTLFLFYSSENKNLLYYFFILSVYAIVVGIVRKTLIKLTFLVLFTVVSVQMPSVKKETFLPIVPAGELNGRGSFVPIKSNMVWIFNFNISSLPGYKADCKEKLEANLFIDGMDLSELKIFLGDECEPYNGVPHKKYGIDQIMVPINLSSEKNIQVRLTSKGKQSPSIHIGTESYKFEKYQYAVWLELKNSSCTILYHSQRKLESRRS